MKNGVDIISSEEFEYNKKQNSEKHLSRLFADQRWKTHVNFDRKEDDNNDGSNQDLFDSDGETISSDKLEAKLEEIDN